MRTDTIEKVYFTFDELDEKQKESAIEKLYDLNVDHEWYDFIYDDAMTVNVEMKYFNSQLDIENFNFRYEAIDTAKAIVENHGNLCGTYKLAKVYIAQYNLNNSLREIFNEIWERTALYDIAENLLYEAMKKYEDRVIDLSEGFLDDLKSEYSSLLKEEYEYLTSDEAIIESIKANEYEFDEDGNLA